MEEPWNVNQLVGANLRRARRLAGMTQKELADKLTEVLGTSWTDVKVSAAEQLRQRKKPKIFRAEELMAFCLILQRPITFFFDHHFPEFEDLEHGPAAVDLGGEGGVLEADVWHELVHGPEADEAVQLRQAAQRIFFSLAIGMDGMRRAVADLRDLSRGAGGSATLRLLEEKLGAYGPVEPQDLPESNDWHDVLEWWAQLTDTDIPRDVWGEEE